MTEETVYKYVISSWTQCAEQRFKKQGRAFDTWEEAHQELLRRAESDIANAERKLNAAQQTMREIQAMELGATNAK